MTNYTFDPSVEQIFATLLHGATLYIIEKEVKLNKKLFTKYINDNQIHIVNMVPTLFKELLLDQDKLESINILISGGERLDDDLKNTLLQKGYELYNHYGPTETTVDALVTKCVIDKKVVLGKPIANTKCYILNKQNTIVPIGVVGEICISGDCMARGYLNRPELTEERFIPNPLRIHLFIDGERLYKTGDLGRWLSDGNIEFMGRIDSQVKIRGFRVELGEIENQLSSHEAVRDAVVIAKEDQGQNYLCAYIVLNSEISMRDLRRYLTNLLPDYMIPAYFMLLDEIPLKSNGKIDYKGLPGPDGNALRSTAYVAPTSEIEVELAKIWSDVLGIEKIGIQDNFFDLGGHSLKKRPHLSQSL